MRAAPKTTADIYHQLAELGISEGAKCKVCRKVISLHRKKTSAAPAAKKKTCCGDCSTKPGARQLLRALEARMASLGDDEVEKLATSVKAEVSKKIVPPPLPPPPAPAATQKGAGGSPTSVCGSSLEVANVSKSALFKLLQEQQRLKDDAAVRVFRETFQPAALPAAAATSLAAVFFDAAPRAVRAPATDDFGGERFMSRFKTTLCEHFQKGYCSFEGRCSFAHGAHELREEIEIDMTGATPPPETQRAAPAPARPPARAGPTPAQAAAAAKVPRPPPAAVRAPTDDELDRAVQLSLRDHATSTADDAALRAILAESKKMSLAPRPPRDDGKWQAEMEALVAPSATPGKWTPDAEYPTLGAHSATPSTWTPDAEYPTRGAHVEPIRASTPADNGKRSIEDLLTELGLLEYMSCLKSQLVFNVRDLSYCDDADLEMCGIHSMYARARILDAAG